MEYYQALVIFIKNHLTGFWGETAHGETGRVGDRADQAGDLVGAAGGVPGSSDDIVSLHRNAQRLLRPLLVANPYANELTFLDDKTRTRRDHMKYLTLIRSIALLHQYQRPIKTMNHKGKHLSYVEVTLDDIKIANRLASEVLGRTLDELPPQSRKLL